MSLSFTEAVRRSRMQQLQQQQQ